MGTPTPGEFVKGGRERKGLTQRQTADLIGVTPGFIAKIEGGESLPGYSACVALSNVLDLALDELWQAVESARREADEKRRRARGEVATGAIRTRGAVRVRGAVLTLGGGGRGPNQIAKEIAGDPDLLVAYKNLRTAMTDPSLRATVMTTLKAWAKFVKSDD